MILITLIISTVQTAGNLSSAKGNRKCWAYLLHQFKVKTCPVQLTRVGGVWMSCGQMCITAFGLVGFKQQLTCWGLMKDWTLQD